MILRNFEQLDIDVIVDVKISFQAIYECIKKKIPSALFAAFSTLHFRASERREIAKSRNYIRQNVLALNEH